MEMQKEKLSEREIAILTFDSEKHQYFWNKKRVPGVSEILKSLGLSRSYDAVDTFYRDRGTAVHKSIELYIKGTLDEESLDPVIVPYFNQAKEWIDNVPLLGKRVEVMEYELDGGYAGTIDLIANDTIYDWKCSKSPDPVSELQGSLYKRLMHKNKFVVIQLTGEGPAIEIPYEASKELAESVLTLYWKWKVKKKEK